MNKKAKRILIAVLSLILAGAVAYCAVFGNPIVASEDTGNTKEEAVETALKLSDVNSGISSGTEIILSDNGTRVDGAGASVSENTVSIASDGTYIVSGSISDGCINVEALGNVSLILNGAEIYCSDGGAINAANASHTQIYLEDGTENIVSSGEEQDIVSADENTSLENTSGAAIYAKGDLSFAGSGALTVCGYINNGAAAADNLVVLSGSITVNAVNNALKGNDTVTVNGGTIKIQCGNDGIKTDNEDENAGTVDINGGIITIESFGDGIQADSVLTVTDGELDITTNGGADEAGNGGFGSGEGGTVPEMPSGGSGDEGGTMPEMPSGGFGGDEGGTMPEMPSGSSGDEGGTMPEMPSGSFGGDEGGTMPEMPSGGFGGGEDGAMPEMPSGGFSGGEDGTPPEKPTDESGDSEEDNGSKREKPSGGFGGFGDDGQSSGSSDEASAKALKSGTELVINGGTFTISSADDAIHTDGVMTVNAGTINIAASDDGLHADTSLTINGGNITVTRSCEGIESNMIYVTGGNISVTASDDGFNANGGSSMFGGMFSSSGSSDDMPTLKISGGTVYVNASGDGLDSNGDLIIEGGNVFVDGPTNGGNGALDSGTENGGSLVCNGGTVIAIGSSGMAESFESDSTQCSFQLVTDSTHEAGTQITICSEDGTEIYKCESAKSFDSVVFSSPLLELGSTYTVTVGDEEQSITLDSVASGESGFSMGGGGMGGRHSSSK